MEKSSPSIYRDVHVLLYWLCTCLENKFEGVILIHYLLKKLQIEMYECPFKKTSSHYGALSSTICICCPGSAFICMLVSWGSHPYIWLVTRLFEGWARKIRKLAFWECDKVIYPKYSKHWPYTVAYTIYCVSSKMLHHGLKHGLFLSLFKPLPASYIELYMC